MKFHFKGLLQNTGWLNDTTVEVDAAGIITLIHPGDSKEDCDEIVEGFALPGFQNAHSHAFQYAMAGLAENHPSENNADNFWSWRDKMYSLALSVSPDQLEAIAAMLYAEMLRHGYTNVVEFHYLHHNTSGLPYMNVAEMGERLVSAAMSAGIRITLVPIFYQQGGFGRPPEDNQRRFLSRGFDEYARLFEASDQACKGYSGANIGVGLHSLRAVEASAIKRVSKDLRQDIPFHIHISEQMQEIEDCLSFYGTRPVEWMLDNVEVSNRFHFVHATHINNDETYGLADMNVNVVICPTTEGNLGDGVFPLEEFQRRGGHWSIGTDSHVSLNPFEEIRLLDYGQRLKTHKRNTFAFGDKGSSGAYAIEQAITNGRMAMNNFESRYFGIGMPFDACVISSDNPLIGASSNDNLLNTIIYSSDESMQEGTIVNGEWKSRKGRHIRQKEIADEFICALKALNIR